VTIFSEAHAIRSFTGLTLDNKNDELIHILHKFNAARRHLHLQLPMLWYNRYSLLSSAALQWVPRATVKHRICIVCGRYSLKQWYEIQQLGIRHIVKPRRHSDLQNSSDEMATEAFKHSSHHQANLKERRGKEEYLYSAILYTMYISKRSGMDHTVLPANTPCLPFLRKRSPDGATLT